MNEVACWWSIERATERAEAKRAMLLSICVVSCSMLTRASMEKILSSALSKGICDTSSGLEYLGGIN